MPSGFAPALVQACGMDCAAPRRTARAVAVTPEPRVPSLPGRSVLVTGATGFIGGHLAERLVSTGSRVRAVVRRPERAAGLRDAGAEVIAADLSDPETLRGSCEGIEFVFHCGAWLGTPYTWDAAYTTNVTGTRAMALEALRAAVARFVHLSSIAVYGPVRSGVVTEQSPLWKGVELYGDSKIDGEHALRAIILRG